jgi:peptide/nickel transport system substrate-binding protein
MPENPIVGLNELYLRFRDGAIDRRQLVVRASALGLSTAALSRFLRAVPPVSAAEPVASITRAEWKQRLGKAFPFTLDPGAEADGGRIVLGRLASSPVTTLNLMLANDTPTQALLNLCQEYLVGVSPIDGQFVPALADAWEIAGDGRTYTFHLNRDAHWHDGKPFTANDVVFSFRAQEDEETGTQFQASFVNAVESYRRLDANTVEIVARDVFAPVVFLGNALTPIVPKHIWQDVPFADWRADPGSTGADSKRVIGTGPFKFDSLSNSGRTVIFSRYDDYHDGAPIVDSLVLKIVRDDAAALDALRGGAINVYERVPVDNVQTLSDDGAYHVAVYDTYSFIWYGTNLDPEKTRLFQDGNVRRALMYGLDREIMVEQILDGLGEVAHGTQPLLSPAYDPSQVTTLYDYSPKRASELLDEAGWTDEDGDGIREKDGVPFSFEVMFVEGSAQVEQAVTMMRTFWSGIGVEARPKPVDYGSELLPALTGTFDFEMVALGFTWDASGDQSPMFGSLYKGVGFNAVGYANPDYDRLAEAANRETDSAKRRQLLIRASNIVNDDLPIGILWFRRDATASSSKLHNFTPNGYSLLWSLPWVWVE